MRPGRFVVPAVLALSGALVACNGAEPFSPDASSLEGRGVSRSVDDAICQFRLSLVTVNLSASTVAVGGSVDASAVLMGWHDNILDLTPDWYTSDANIARVEGGKVIGVSAGTTEVHAQCYERRGSATITVTAQSAPDPGHPPTGSGDGVMVTLAPSRIQIGQTIWVTAAEQQADGQVAQASGATPTWSSSNKAVAEVNSLGQLTGSGDGTATITAVINGRTGSAVITVGAGGTSTPAPDPTPEPPPTTPTTPPVVDVPGGSGVVAALPELPRQGVPDAAYVAPTGRVIRVASGGDLQGALNSAVPGDQVLLAAGAQFVGNFELRPKASVGASCSAWVTVTSETTLPSPGTRVTPSSAANFARIASPNQDAAIKTTARGSCYRIVGVEITVLASWTGLNYGMTMFGEDAHTSLSEIPHGIVLDRVYLHGQPSTNSMRCVALNSARSAIINSWISDCHARATDSQAIEGWTGPGPYLIENNYVEGAGENIMFGGADPKVSGMSPSDITVRRNHIAKNPSWKGVWVVKNLLELKHAKRMLVEGNVMENNWADGQSGMAIVLKTSGERASWTHTADITIRYNIIRNSPRGFNVQGIEAWNDTPVARVRLENNLFESIGTYNNTVAGGYLNLITHTPNDIAVVHNTMTHNVTNGLALMMDYGAGGARRLQVDDNVFTNPTGYAVFYSGMPVGSAALNAMAGSSWSYTRNVAVDVDPAYAGMHPAASWYPSMAQAGFVNAGGGDYRFGSGSPYKGKAGNGRDPGVDFDELNRRTSGVVVR